MVNLFAKYLTPFALSLSKGFIECSRISFDRLRTSGRKRSALMTMVIFVLIVCSVTMCVAQQQSTNVYTQSQAHLRLKTVRELLGKEFSTKIIPYFDIISQVLVREALYKKSHYAFYHTTSSAWTVVSDLFAQLHAYFKLDEKVSSTEIASEEFKKDGLIDSAGHLALLLLSVNFAVFGNVGSQAQDMWKLFIKDVQKAPSAKIFEKMMDTFGLTHNYIPEMIALEELIHTPEASLLQIFVPQKSVDQLVYVGLLGKGDFSLSKEELEKKFKKEKMTNPKFKEFMESLHAGKLSAYAFLQDYCNKPLEIENINEATGLLAIAPEGLFNAASGITVYRYLTTSREKMTEYMTRLEALVQKLIAEKK